MDHLCPPSPSGEVINSDEKTAVQAQGRALLLRWPLEVCILVMMASSDNASAVEMGSMVRHH